METPQPRRGVVRRSYTAAAIGGDGRKTVLLMDGPPERARRTLLGSPVYCSCVTLTPSDLQLPEVPRFPELHPTMSAVTSLARAHRAITVCADNILQARPRRNTVCRRREWLSSNERYGPYRSFDESYSRRRGKKSPQDAPFSWQQEHQKKGDQCDTRPLGGRRSSGRTPGTSRQRGKMVGKKSGRALVASVDGSGRGRTQRGTAR